MRSQTLVPLGCLTLIPTPVNHVNANHEAVSEVCVALERVNPRTVRPRRTT